jgi:hypothetical protein
VKLTSLIKNPQHECFHPHPETILGPATTYITAEEINRRINAILGLADPGAELYDGTDLPSDDATREIEATVQTYRAMGDTAVLPDALTLFDNS